MPEVVIKLLGQFIVLFPNAFDAARNNPTEFVAGTSVIKPINPIPPEIAAQVIDCLGRITPNQKYEAARAAVTKCFEEKGLLEK